LEKKLLTGRWMPPPVLAVVLVWLPVKTPLPRLFTSAKINHLNALPQGKPEANRRVN
jgi:hypothetical protein